MNKRAKVAATLSLTLFAISFLCIVTFIAMDGEQRILAGTSLLCTFSSWYLSYYARKQSR